MESKKQTVDKRLLISQSCICVGGILQAFVKNRYAFWLGIGLYLAALALSVALLIEELKKKRKQD